MLGANRANIETDSGFKSVSLMNKSVNISENYFLAPIKWHEEVTNDGIAELFLVVPDTSLESIPSKETWEARLIEPLRHSGLFKRFAELKTNDEILEFANQLGLLGVYQPPSKIGIEEPGERLSLWQSQIDSMNDCITLWEALKQGNYQFLEKNTRPIPGMLNIEFFSPSSKRWKTIGFSPDYFTIDIHNCFERGAAALSYLVQSNLYAEVFPDLTWRNSESPFVFSLRLRANTLKGALWLQLSEAIAANTEVRQCTCGKWFSVGGGRRNTKKKDADFCSKNCGLKTWRSKKSKPVISP
jgi:hypothetical protein